MSLPAADDLFRPTSTSDEPAEPSLGPAAVDEVAVAEAPPRRPSGRVRHDEKMTVYVTSDELLDLEHTRLVLRRAHGVTADRGRIVREAVALALADFAENGEDSQIVRRLRES